MLCVLKYKLRFLIFVIVDYIMSKTINTLHLPNIKLLCRYISVVSPSTS